MLTALLLSRLLGGERRPAEQARAFFLSLLLAFGLGNIANDAWLEQIAERGWSSHQLPSVLGFTANWLWLAVLLTGGLVWLAWLSTAQPPTNAPRPVDRAREREPGH